MPNYVIGSAADPDPANRVLRDNIETRVKLALFRAGVAEYSASEVASDLVVAYLVKGNPEAWSIVRAIAGPAATDDLTLLSKRGN